MTDVPIVSRAGWGADPLSTPAGWIDEPTRDLILHHTASTGLHGPEGVRSIQQGALSGGYVDIEYSYMIDSLAPFQVYETRGHGRNTAAQGCGDGSYNKTGSAICVMDNFEVNRPADGLLTAIARLVTHGAERRWWPSQITHSHGGGGSQFPQVPQCSTACCGRYLIEKIPEINRRAASGMPNPVPPTSKGTAVEIVWTRSGRGYWITASDGGVFAFGDAKFYGSAAGFPHPPIVGMAARPQDDGYALTANDGAVYCFGNARYRGGMNGKKLAAPIVDIEFDPDGDGYVLLGGDGGTFAFNAPNYGNATPWIKP